ncbi:golgin subfamily A member 2-like isoform X2 [Falco naumanni]|uniref:golgin subfamily A member 2-like isoform X2 n=1 Tax=Falco naumanni TaxID=148594 RepID=UPI001ADDF6F1|nr:golgin subfamily A member 2-like isoform X2 [Falco naumanni]XP_040463606.1 golgin subfamily A member 2-like isoform X2 [Falco naumanni]
MAVEVLLCIARALSALFSPGDYPRLLLSDFLLILLKLSSLFATLTPTQLSRKGEAESLADRLRSSRQRVVELERTLASVSLQQKQAEKHNEQLMKGLEDLKEELYKQSKSNEVINQKNLELSEKIHCLSSKISAKDLRMDDLHQKLEMAEQRIQQLSGSVPRLQAERHQYAEKRKEVRRMWQQ